MLITKISVCAFHAMRSYAVVFSKMLRTWLNVSTYSADELDKSCFTETIVHGEVATKQAPFARECLGPLDISLLCFTALASIGVIICTMLIFVVGFEHFKIFNQSHYSGRVGNVTGNVWKDMKNPANTIHPNPAGIRGDRAYDTTITRATELATPEGLNKMR